tara:strand:+ start:464 stop:577 length:114 start_codon:yes stop_codon:yes gene_type:complete
MDISAKIIMATGAAGGLGACFIYNFLKLDAHTVADES